MKVCIEEGCWQPTPDTRCPEHQRVWRRRKDAKYATPAHRGLVLAGPCECCGSTEDLCRDHVSTLIDPLYGHYTTRYQVLCRSCNGSKGGRVMVDQKCPKHGGTSA